METGNQTIKLDLGCGNAPHNGYIGIDFVSSPNITHVINIGETELPYDNNSVDEVLISHALEHLLKRQMDFCLSEIYRVLKDGGKLTVIVPDMKYICNRFATTNSLFEKETMIKQIYGHQHYRVRSVAPETAAIHYNGFDEELLQTTLERFKFKVLKHKLLQNNEAQEIHMLAEK